MEDRKDVIPFGKAVRVGNYKVWRSRHRSAMSEVAVVNVSSLDGLFMVRIPSTMEMYGWICMAYGDYVSDDVSRKSQGEAVLTTVFGNILYTSCIVNGYYQRALEMLATVYAHPTLLDRKDKEHKVFMKDVKGLCDAFLEWRKGYDAQERLHEPTDDDLHREEIADEAMAMLEGSDSPE